MRKNGEYLCQVPSEWAAKVDYKILDIIIIIIIVFVIIIAAINTITTTTTTTTLPSSSSSSSSSSSPSPSPPPLSSLSFNLPVIYLYDFYPTSIIESGLLLVLRAVYF
jgi:hypothetical protein